ncbi:E3 ubiquitin-protein ligase complex slx8-rfp subunit slx8 [Pseudocercospora fuligena]|uniref:E3 ubiquitin-protein ligase complex slx8-rfp subunit slx8 n=1 Tax=Pseudocercospora fuligena TaxID=685502 RepID=A0A8H6RE94_9PEZI|nr:E3 ubiquitin-protein ligase complex slx8-rfp subunit slx8 [Pseudocercospora fuligena]
MAEWNFDDLNNGELEGYSQEDLDIYREMAIEHSGEEPFPNGTRNGEHRTNDRFLPSSLHDREPAAAVDQLFGYDLANTFFESVGNTPASNNNSDSQEFVTLEDSETDSSMPPATRRRTNGRRSTAVDLTSAASSPEPSASRPTRSTRKRSADDTNAGEGRAPKRKRSVAENIEEVDLTNEAPSAEDELLQAQQQETIKAQQAAEESSGPQRIGKRQCIICMENYTNCTATACGHFYCHECLVRALMAGAKSSDRATGTCPVCRKPLSHTNKKKTDVIPMSFMTKAEFDRQRRIKGV